MFLQRVDQYIPDGVKQRAVLTIPKRFILVSSFIVNSSLFSTFFV